MKKILSVILCFAMLMSFSPFAASAADELVINIATDIHLNNIWEKPVPKRNNISESFAHVANQGKLNSESKAIIASFLDKATTDKSEVILVPGDLADCGLEKEMIAVADMFRAFEEKTGKQIYVVPGNHDVLKLPASLFAGVFADFGYNEAIAKDTDSASYVADLPDGYRLLAIDSTAQGSGGSDISAETSQWIRQQAEQAQKDGKKTIAMMHHNLIPHMVLIDVFHKGAVVGDAVGLKEIFAKYGVKYVFTGHTHENDIASYTGAGGEVVYDVVTASMNVYPCSYRTVTFGDEVKFEMNCIDGIDTSAVPDGMSDEAFTLMENDFIEYSKKSFMLGMDITINGTVCKASNIKKILNLNADENPEICTLIDKLIPKLNEAVNMPLYAEDEVEEGKSIENVLSYYGVTIPDSEYTNMIEVAATVYARHIEGDENLQAYNNEIVLACKGIGAALAYTLSDVTAEEYAQALGFVCKLIDFDLSENLLSFAGDKIKKFEGIELVVSTAILPLILKVTVDDAPADCNVTLPGYGQLVEPPAAEMSFWDKVQEFFIKIMTFFMSLFSFMF